MLSSSTSLALSTVSQMHLLSVLKLTLQHGRPPSLPSTLSLRRGARAGRASPQIRLPLGFTPSLTIIPYLFSKPAPTRARTFKCIMSETQSARLYIYQMTLLVVKL